ncbi:MAG: ABC transporter substrate-binding protein [Halanaerobiaceae bacterium]
MKKTSLIIFIIIFILTIAVIPTKAAEKQEKIELIEVVHSIFYAPQYVALNKGFFKEEGLNIELSTAWGGDKAASTLMSNSGDIALIGPEPSIYIYERGAKDYLVNFAQLTNTAGSFLVAREPISNFTWEDVKGKTIIGNRPGGAPQMVLEYSLKSRNIIPGEDVEVITNLDFTANAGAFVEGLGDFVQLFEPAASTLEAEEKGYVVDSFGKAGGNIPYTVYMAKKNYIENNPEKIQAFTNAIYKAQIWVENKEPEEIADVIESHFSDTKRDILVNVITRYKEQGTWNNNPVIKKDIFNHYQDIMILAEELSEKIPYEKLVNTSFAEKAKTKIDE